MAEETLDFLRKSKNRFDTARNYSLGKAIRGQSPRRDHSRVLSASARPDPIENLQVTSEGRIDELIPIRYGRMSQSPFAFYRGTAALMAENLSRLETTGIKVQACGDCHLLNFGGFATPERKVVLDINDFDETFPASWEWDLKRLCVSFVLAGRENSYKESKCLQVAETAARAYRKNIWKFSRMSALEVWYDSLDVDTIVSSLSSKKAKLGKRLNQRITKLRSRSFEHHIPKVTESSNGAIRFKEEPPLIFHPGKLFPVGEFEEDFEYCIQQYRNSLNHNIQILFDHYEIVDVAIKVVGIGSVGTFCGLLLLMSSDHDPLVLQIKQATQSVLEPFWQKSSFKNHGRRVVEGQRLIQAASDIFLGWSRGKSGMHYYFRQWRDVKIKPLTHLWDPFMMNEYAKYCGWVLARAHAKSGESGMIAGYLGKSDQFDKVMAKFARSYADQTEADYEKLCKAIKSGHVEAEML